MVIYTILYVLYVIVCVTLILLVLIQQTKGGGLAGAFGGGGGSETFFGYTSMQQIGKLTIWCATAFLLLSIIIGNYPLSPASESVVPFDPAQQQMPTGQMPPGPPGANAPTEGEQPQTGAEAPAAGPQQPETGQ